MTNGDRSIKVGVVDPVLFESRISEDKLVNTPERNHGAQDRDRNKRSMNKFVADRLSKIEPGNRDQHEQSAGEADKQTALQRIEDFQEEDQSQNRNRPGQRRGPQNVKSLLPEQRNERSERDDWRQEVNRIECRVRNDQILCAP